MYIDNSGGRYYRGTEQCCRKAPFLILMSCEKNWGQEYEGKEKYRDACPICPHKEKCNPIAEAAPADFVPRYKEKFRGIVRKVAMQQCGQFMMGRVRIKNKSFTLSGSYGSDGLSADLPPDIYILGTVLPDELHEAWNKGGGWNGCGTEAPKMAQWALSLMEK
jgi:hypothetical protein